MENFNKIIVVFGRKLSPFAQAVGIIAYAGLQWLVLIRLLPIGGYTLVGNYALAQAVVAPVVGFFAFSMRPLWVSGAIGGLSAGNVLAIRIATGVTALAVAVFLAFIFGMRIYPIIFIYVLGSKFLDTISDILAAMFDKQGRSPISGALLIMKSALSALIVILSWAATLDLITTMTALLIFQLFAVFMEWKIGGSTNPCAFRNFSGWFTAFPLSTAFFAALNSLVASIAGFLPRYLLEFFSDRETVGYFSTIYIPVLMIQMVATGLSQTNLHRLSKVVHTGNIRKILLDSAPVSTLIAGFHIVITIMCFSAIYFADWFYKDLRTILQDMALVLAVSLPLSLRQFYSYLAVSGGRMTAVFISSFVILAAQVIFSPWAIQTGSIFGCVILMSAGAAIQIGIFLWILHQPRLVENYKRG